MALDVWFAEKVNLLHEEIELSDSGSPGYPISSVGNALRLLLLFRDKQSVRLVEARDYLGVAHSTAHRLLAMLIQFGFVRQDGSRAYRPGPMLVEIGLAVVQKMDVRAQARPFLESLGRQFAETIHLTVLEGNLVRFVDAVESDRALRVAVRTGQLLPANCTSAGKALLAELNQSQVRALYPMERLPTQTAHSLTSIEALEQELDKIRKLGYATNREESEDGVGSVAIALVNAANRPVAAVAVAVPVNRLTPSIQATIVESLKKVRLDFQAQFD